MNEEKTNATQQSNKKKIVLITAAVAVVLFALAVGVGIYNTPANRLQRQLDLGNKYLEEQNYEQAAIAFEETIAIDDRCMEAYAGGMKAYQNMKDAESLLALYERALKAAGELDADALAADRDYLVEIYLMTEEIYGHNPERAVECLMEGYLLTAEDEQIKEQLVEMYLKWADELVEQEDYEKAISELTNGYEKTQDERLNEKIAEVQEKYKQYLDWIAYVELVDDILVRIAASCNMEDYQAVFALMQSDEYAGLLERVDEIEETMGLETEYGSIGLYKTDSEVFGNYMIYYGDYEGDVRQGEGVWLGYYDSNNYIAKGSWAGDLPQGEFAVREWHEHLAEDVVYRVISGNVNNGLWDGDVMWTFEETDGSTSSFPVSFQNGKWLILGYDENGDAIVCEKGSAGGSMVVKAEREGNVCGIVGFAADN